MSRNRVLRNPVADVSPAWVRLQPHPVKLTPNLRRFYSLELTGPLSRLKIEALVALLTLLVLACGTDEPGTLIIQDELAGHILDER